MASLRVTGGDLDGAGRSELPAYLMSQTLGCWPIGWSEHDGIMFDN
jgi:hypothetical protein